MNTRPAPATQCEELGRVALYAHKLLVDLGIHDRTIGARPDKHAVIKWAESGLMALTGRSDAVPLICPVPLADCADAVITAMRLITGSPGLEGISGVELLTERAALLGLARRGSTSPGGSCRLLRSYDGHIGLNLARDSDWELLSALFQRDVSPDWSAVTRNAGLMPTEALLRQGRILGLAIADAVPAQANEELWFKCIHRGQRATNSARSPRVLDLSSLWAGPLCSHLLQVAGAIVIKVESRVGPVDSRRGATAFFERLHEGKKLLTLDLRTDPGRQQLLELIETVDIVIEGSRPRALRQMGIVAEKLIEKVPGLTWISITGHGRQEPQGNWIAYGDDAGVVAGLSAIMYEATGEWAFCGDAVADPLTGMHAALAAWSSWHSGGGQLIDISLSQTVRHCIAQTRPKDGNYGRRYLRWSQYLDEAGITTAMKSGPNFETTENS